MQFVNEITLDAPPDELFKILSDVERVAPCLPGAKVYEKDGDLYRGSMRVKVGPVTAEYDGTLEFVELDEAARRAVLQARASETGGQGGAEARIVASVAEEESGSRVTMETDLEVRGRVAQFGRGPMEKISKRIFADFAKNLEQTLAGGQEAGAKPEPPASGGGGGTPAPQPAASQAPAPAQGSGPVAAAEAPPLNLIGGGWVLPGTIGLALGFVIGRIV